ncbi:MAG: PF20097 family protein [Candidatus Odinarchaeota archaeon]
MWCSTCNRVFDTLDSGVCPVCGMNSLHKTPEIACPICGVKMKPGYISVPLKIDWRDKWVKSGDPKITISDRVADRGWLRRLTYYCENCSSFFLYNALKTFTSQAESVKKTLIGPLCPECGSEIIEKINFCPFCGFKIKDEDEKKIHRLKLGL